MLFLSPLHLAEMVATDTHFAGAKDVNGWTCMQVAVLWLGISLHPPMWCAKGIQQPSSLARFAKIMNLFLKEKINPLIGAAGVSAVPDSARVVQMVGQQEDPHNHLLMHAMAPNVAGVIGSAIAAGVLWSVLVK